MFDRIFDQPVIIQRVESSLIFVASIYFYFHLHFNWLWFLIFLFSVDIFMIGYLSNNSRGAKLYNLGHNYSIPAALAIIGVMSNTNLLLAAGIIWTAHVAMDRSLGYGLKLPTRFKDTHLGHIK